VTYYSKNQYKIIFLYYNRVAMDFKFFCKRCNFITYDKKDYQRHCKTSKHKKSKWSCKDCGKQYKYPSGLSRHKCKKELKNDDEIMGNLIIEKQGGGNNFNELLTIIKEQQKQLNKSHELIQMVMQENKDIIPRIGNNNISINVYLNEQCKNAMNLKDFVDNLDISLEDLKYTQQHGYVEGITNIFTKQLKDLQPTERPIHCSDVKRMQFYVKEDNIWSKDDEHKKIEKSIQDIKMKQIKQLKNWEEENPLFITNENLLNQWQKMVKEIIGPEENAKTKEKDMFYIKKQLANTIPVKFALKNK
jgi:hypothetical protein